MRERDNEAGQDEISWRDGDVYRWHYTAEARKLRELYTHDAHWCCSCIGVVKNGLLRDTYWGNHSDGTRAFTKEVAAKDLNLRYQGNIADLVPVNHWEAAYYEESDIVDMRHRNSSRDLVYRRKESSRSKERMLDVVREKRREAESDINSAIHTIERLGGIVARIESGAPLSEIYL